MASPEDRLFAKLTSEMGAYDQPGNNIGGQSFDDEAPYLQTMGIEDKQLLHIPVIEQDEDQRQLHNKVGLRRLICMELGGNTTFKNEDGSMVHLNSWEMVRYTPYTHALTHIGKLEAKKEIGPGTYGRALTLMLKDKFDQSDLAQYLPRQESE